MNNNQIKKYFGEQEVVFIEKDNDLWLTAEQLGTVLEYSDPRVAIMKIFIRHKDILKNFSVVTKLVTTGGKKDVTIFNEIACNIIAMKSNTKKANEFVVWAAGIITEYRHGLLVKKDSQPQRPKLPPASLLAEMRKLKLDGLSITIWLNENYNFPISPSLIVLTALKEMNATEKDVKDLIKKFGYTRDIMFWIDINKKLFKEKERLAAVLGLTTQHIWGKDKEEKGA